VGKLEAVKVRGFYGREGWRWELENSEGKMDRLRMQWLRSRKFMLDGDRGVRRGDVNYLHNGEVTRNA
jgi:hypothetical protein